MQPSLTNQNVTIFHLSFVFLPLLAGVIHSICKRNTPGFSKSECFLTYFLIIVAGIQSLLVGYFAIFHPAAVVDYSGWTASPFLTELGFANISFGILGVLSYWFKNGWRTATGVLYSSFVLMAGYSHIRAVYFTHTYELTHLGPLLISDFFVGGAILLLLVLRKLS